MAVDKVTTGTSEFMDLVRLSVWSDLKFSSALTLQFFGNTITCEWWDQIWLNEAPASYYEHMAVDAVTEGTDEFMDLVRLGVVAT